MLLLACLCGAPAAFAVDEPGSIVWHLSADGDWLGATRADAGPAAPLLVLAPLQPAPAENAAGLVGSLGLGDAGALRLAVAATERWNPADTLGASAPWCDGFSGLLAVPGFANECQGIGGGNERQPSVAGARAQMAWSNGPLDLAVNYARAQGNEVVPAWGIGGLTGNDSLGSPSHWSYSVPGTGANLIEGRDLGLSGQYRLTPDTALSMSASYGDLWSRSPTLPGAGPQAWNQTALRVGMSYGPFSGGITGRVVRPEGPGTEAASEYTGLDLGVSWRTPWRGELSFGAENLISRGDINALPDVPPTSESDPSAARTPYVRYKQDL
jgi:hypothetical protein